MALTRFELTSEALIRAPPAVVYELIADVDRYADWNPWNFRASGGPAVEGGIVTMTVRLGERTMNVRHRVLVGRPGERLVTRDLGWFTGLASGDRARELEVDPEGTRYRVTLTITGPLCWMVRRLYGEALEVGMRAETEALRRAAEASERAQTSTPLGCGARPARRTRG